MLEANKKQAFKLLEAQKAVMSEKLNEIMRNGENVQQDITDIRERLNTYRNQIQQNPDHVSSVLVKLTIPPL